jgi:hypothetical protein
MYINYDRTIFDKYQILSFYDMFEFQTQKVLPILNTISDIASRIKQLREIVKKPSRMRYEENEINYFIDKITILSEHLKELNLSENDLNTDLEAFYENKQNKIEEELEEI